MTRDEAEWVWSSVRNGRSMLTSQDAREIAIDALMLCDFPKPAEPAAPLHMYLGEEA